MPTYGGLLKQWEKEALAEGKEPTAVKLLLLHFAPLSPAELVAALDEEMPMRAKERFLHAVREYVHAHKPIQHITGYEDFFGRSFFVNPHVLIPRYETEELAEHVIDYFDAWFAGMERVFLLDIGTGSGSLAITLALERNVHVSATDISSEALAVARKNCERFSSDVRFLQGDLFEPVQNERFHIIVSNPPYIPESETLPPDVDAHEPSLALRGGEDGLLYFRKIIRQLPKHLRTPYLVAFEHSYEQASSIRRLLEDTLRDVSIIQKKDMQGRDRLTFATDAM